MQNLLNTVLLICAAMGSLALGVLLAYLSCNAAFRLLRVQARSYAAAPQAKPQIARVS